MKTNLKKLEKSQIEIEFELDIQEFQKHIDGALLHLKEQVKIDGFRKGHVPEKIVEEKIGNENLLMEAGDLAVKQSYKKFVNENNLEPIGEPEVQILKIAKGSPLLFKVKVAVLPSIDLPNYKEIASKVGENKISVEPQEIEDTIRYLQKSRAKLSQVDRGAEKKDFVEIVYWNEHINPVRNKSPEATANSQANWISNGIKDRFIMGESGFMKDFEDNLIGMKAGEEKEFTAKFPENNPKKELAGKKSNFKVKMISVQKMELQEINDEFAKSLGVFDNLVALKENLKEGITMEKQGSEKQRRRGEILNKISEKITFDLPEKMIEYEKARLFEDFKNQVSQNFKITFEEYLSFIKKTEEEVKKSFSIEAEKRIKNFLVLKEIGKREYVKASNEEIEEELNKLIKKYSKDQIDKIDINQLREYTEGTIYNEKVFQRLENFSKIEN